MAQQLATLRTPAAYAGVTKYAQQHTGEAAAAAYLALGHAYLLDKRFAEATDEPAPGAPGGRGTGRLRGFSGRARPNHEAGNDAAAEALLHGFAERYPDSIFDAQAPELEANVLLAMSNAAERAAGADGGCRDRAANRRRLSACAGAGGARAGADAGGGADLQAAAAGPSAELRGGDGAGQADGDGRGDQLTAAELRSLGDAYYNAGRYEDAERAISRAGARAGPGCRERATGLPWPRRPATEAEAADHGRGEALPDTQDENGARRLYLLMELARNRNDLDEPAAHRGADGVEVSRRASGWPRRSSPAATCTCCGATIRTAVEYYSYLATHFPESTNAAAAHWRAGWLSYRQGLYADAARLFDEQIRLYPGAKETVAALYWRGRLYETQDHKPAKAAANYRTMVRAYQHFFYAQMARQRLAALGNAQPVAAAATGSLAAAAGAGAGGELSRPTARTWPRRGCWPMPG